MNPEQAAALRKPFPDELIGHLPRAGTTLSYVGHAAVTDRLLAVDPEWTWEPMALDADGCPLIRRGPKEAELWIRLTVCGVTRPAVGTALVGAFELPKQLISDAIRNGAMRFGVALDLWSKEDLTDRPPNNVDRTKRALVDALRDAGVSDVKGAARTLWDTYVPDGCTYVDDDLYARLEAAARDLGEAK